MPLTLQIDADEKYEFFVLYDQLSPLRKKIWNKIADRCRAWTDMKASQSKIAEWCECSRSAISEALRLFQNYGWINLQSRGWKKSKRVHMPHTKQQIDVNNRNYFKEVRATYKATHTIPTYRKNTGKKDTGLIDICQRFKKKEIPIEVQLKLSMVSEYARQEAFYQCQKKAKKGFKPDDEARYIAQVAIKIAVKNGEKLDWPSYFYTRDVLRKESHVA